MLVKSILADKGSAVATVAPTDTIASVASLLAEKRYGAVVVADGEKHVAGILSERDIVRGVAEKGAAALDGPVSSLMTTNVFTCSPEDTVDTLMEMMTARRIRHLPVVENEALVGIISIGDVVKRKIEEAEKEAESLREYIATG